MNITKIFENHHLVVKLHSQTFQISRRNIWFWLILIPSLIVGAWTTIDPRDFPWDFPWPIPKPPPYRGQPQPFGVADGRSTQVHLVKGEGLGSGETGGFVIFCFKAGGTCTKCTFFFGCCCCCCSYKSSFPPIFNQVKTIPYRKIELGKLSIDLSFEKQTSNPSLQQQESPLRKT